MNGTNGYPHLFMSECVKKFRLVNYTGKFGKMAVNMFFFGKTKTFELIHKLHK